jgi:hypothetical protein
MPRSVPPDLIKFLKPYDREIRDLAVKVRALVIEEMAPCYENIYDAYSAVAIGYGTSDRLGDGICHIAVYARHVNLGFNDGASLADPQKILKGTGKSIRHVTIKETSDLTRPEIRSYLRRARRSALAEVRKLGRPVRTDELKGNQVISVVKAIYPRKRRPS